MAGGRGIGVPDGSGAAPGIAAAAERAMISADLTGRTALVTGGASGIGLATVTRLAELGAQVALNHLPGDPAGPAAAARLAERGLAVSAVAGDVSKAGAAEAMVGDAIATLGRLDFLVNNAGTPGTREPIPRRGSRR